MLHIVKTLIVMMVVWGAPMTQASAEEVSPKTVVETAVNGIVEVLKHRSHSDSLTEEDRKAIRQQVNGRFDYEEMARRSVGADWDTQSADKQAAFTAVFRDLLEYTYGNRLASYKNQSIVFEDAEFKRDKARVQTRVIDGSKETPVDYRLYQNNQVWMVYDIKIEGVSLVGTFRQDFKSSLMRDGFDGLLSALKDKVSKMKEKDAA